MASIVFFEKTGCINNTKQKKILESAGHNVEAIDLLYHPWSREQLLSFFDELEVKDWFNKNAPKVASGEIVPESFDRESALDALLNERILIKRPLLVVGDTRLVGFDKEKLDELIGLTVPESSDAKSLLSQDLSLCPQKSNGYSCD